MEAITTIPLKNFIELNTEIQILKTDLNHLSGNVSLFKNEVDVLKDSTHQTNIRLTKIEQNIDATNNILLWILGTLGTIACGIIISLASSALQ